MDRSEGSHGGQKPIIREVLTERSASEAVDEFDYFSAGKFEDWEDQASDLGEKWRNGIKDVAEAWNELNEEERFATLQQVGSILRTSLVNDLESRLR